MYDTNGTITGANPEADDMSYAYLYIATRDVVAAAWTYYLPNANYSVAGTGDASGTVIERLDYSASGDFAVGPAGSYAHDADADADIDLHDFANLQVCFGTTVPACLDIHDFDLEGQSNGVINIDDFDGFAQCFNGPDFAPLPGCEVAPPKFRGTVPETGMFTLHGRPIDVLPDGKVLTDFRTRIYDPQHGRWLQRDRAGYVDGANLYESFKTNPQTFTDPHGTDVWVTADAKEVTDASGREWWEITYTRHRNKLDVGYVFTFYQWWWDEWDNPNFSETQTIVEYFPRREGINIWNRIAAEQERLVEDFTANADAKAYRDAIVLAASAPIQIATAGTAQTIVASGAAKIGITSSTALGRIGISATTNALVSGAGEAGGTAVLVPFGEATLGEVGEAGLRGAVVGGITGGVGRGLFEASPSLQRLILDPMLARARATSAASATRARVMANIGETQAARASSNIDVLFAKEAQLRAGYAADVWSMTTVPKGSILYGGIPGQSAFYTDAATLVRSAGSRATLFQSLQVGPHARFGYRPAVSMYEVMSDIRVPSGAALSNPALGPGGGNQFFIRTYPQQLRELGFIPLGQ